MRKGLIPALIILFAVSSLFASANGTAATTLLSESFEEAFPPSGWRLISNGFVLDGLAQTASKARTGNYSMIAEVSYVSLDDWLVTSAVNLSGVSSAKLVFYEDQVNWESNGNHHYIKVSTTSQSDVASFTTVLDMTPANHDVAGFGGAPVQVDLSAYAGESTVYIAFHIVTSSSDVWYVDDVKVTSPQEHDVAVLSLNMDEHYTTNTTVQPVATVSNEGLNSESFTVNFGYYNWDGSMNILDTESVTGLAAGALQDVTFDNYTIGDFEYEFFAQTVLTGDMDVTNDIASKFVNGFSHKKDVVLAEKFGGVTCTYCPGAAMAIDSLDKAHHDSVAIIDYHSYSTANDPYSNDDATGRSSYYGIGGVPNTIFNGTAQRGGGAAAGDPWDGIYDDYEALYYAGLEELTPYDVALSFTEDGETINATATTTFLSASYKKTNIIHFALVESHIYYVWQTSMDSLQFVERKMYPDYNGQLFYSTGTVPYAGMTVNTELEFTIPDGVVKDNSELVCFIQDPASKEVLTATRVALDNPVSDIADGDSKTMPGGFELKQNYPNPFNPSTVISYRLAKSVPVEVSLYNALGEKIETLMYKMQNAGIHEIHFNASHLASGVYYYKVTAGNFTQTKKMTFMK